MASLEGVEIFVTLDAEEKNKLADFCQEKLVHKGDIIFNEGDEANAMYILKTGSVGIYKNINGEPIHLGDVYAEEVLGEMALFSRTGIRMAKAIALEDLTLITILGFSMDELTKRNPQLMHKIQSIIDTRITKNKIIENTMQKN